MNSCTRREKQAWGGGGVCQTDQTEPACEGQEDRNRELFTPDCRIHANCFGCVIFPRRGHVPEPSAVSLLCVRRQSFSLSALTPHPSAQPPSLPPSISVLCIVSMRSIVSVFTSVPPSHRCWEHLFTASLTIRCCRCFLVSCNSLRPSIPYIMLVTGMWMHTHTGTHAHNLPPFSASAVNSVCLWQISLVWQLLELRF